MAVNESLSQKIKALPLTSGVYLMKDAGREVIYVGKAVSLRKRVQSYFRGKAQNVKTDLLVSHIVDVDHIKTQSEAEALILEASLVRKLQPKYNIDLKDDKSYPYIHISGDKFPLVSVVRRSPKEEGLAPTLSLRGGPKARRSNLTKGQIASLAPLKGPGPEGLARNDRGLWFGPYTDSMLIREALALIRKIFPFRSCDPLPAKACLYNDIGLCEAPCIGKVSTREYRKTISRIVLILEGDSDKLYRQLKDDMERASSAKDFELAAKLRDQLRAIGALYSSSPDVNYFKEAEQLERALGLPRRPERIECIDISTTMGERAVGSLVSFLNGKPDKSNYRKFRIKEVQGMDDFKMVAEVVRRRYGRLKREGAAYPDLVMIDGGKGQLSAAADELKKLQIDIPLISLAKREEEVFVPGRRSPVVLSKDSLALKLLQRARDEAHRFAVSYHRLLRGKKMLEKNIG